MDKTILRKKISELREAMTKEEGLINSAKINDKINSFPPFQTAKTILSYQMIGNEVDLSEINRAAEQNRQTISFPETDPYSNPQEIDLILVPGVAFDPNGNRLGRGGGYFDQYLKEVKGIKIGIAYEKQIVDSVPIEEHDIPMDYLITEERIIDCKKQSKTNLNIQQLTELERQRQQNTLQMIPSENYVSQEVLAASGSILTNKYAEGYPHKRYYQGNEFVDQIEDLTIAKAKEVFGAEHANVQPLSGTPANLAAYMAVLKPGDTILAMKLDHGGHLSHGSKVSFSGKLFNFVHYGVGEDGLLHMAEIRRLALETKPKLIVSGFTAYPRQIDFRAFHQIAQEVGAYSLADISHIAGLIAGGVHPSPFPFTDIVTSTTHKTLRGPRSALIMSKTNDRLDLESKKTLAKKIDSAVFPGMQGGPHQNVIAAKAIAFEEALQPEFKEYAQQVVRNAQVLAETLMQKGIHLVSNGTDNHLILIDLIKTLGQEGLGKQVAVSLEEAGIITNCNTIPFDPATPFQPSGLRLGTPALTTRGMKEPEMRMIGEKIAAIIKDLGNQELIIRTKQEVAKLCHQFPIYGNNSDHKEKEQTIHLTEPKRGQILDGQKISQEILVELKEKIDHLPSKPRLDIILVGDNPQSVLYTNKKKKQCEKIGINCHLHHLPEENNGEKVFKEKIIQTIKELNLISDGIMVQLPFPEHLNTHSHSILETISPEKDVDGLTSTNLGKIAQGQEQNQGKDRSQGLGQKSFAPATPLGIIYLLEKYQIHLKGKEVTIVNHSNIVGKPLAMMLLKRGATVNICHEFTPDLAAYTSKADILISGTGIPHLIKAEMVKEGAVVVDVGIAKIDGEVQICGDVDFDKVKAKTSWITPVPGGIGPMTIATLLKNLVDAVENKEVSNKEYQNDNYE